MSEILEAKKTLKEVVRERGKSPIIQEKLKKKRVQHEKVGRKESQSSKAKYV